MSCGYRYADDSPCELTKVEHRFQVLIEPHAFVEPPAPQAESACPDCGETADPHLCYGRRQMVSGKATTRPDPGAAVRAIARAEADSIATRWVPAHMTARQGMVDDITASLTRYRALGCDDVIALLDAERDSWLTVDRIRAAVITATIDAIARRGKDGS